MSSKHYDIIIIGSGIAGLFTAYNIKKISPNTSFLILEKHKKKWIGGRVGNEMFYGSKIVTGAGIGRKNKDKLLINLMDELKVKYTEYNSNVNYAEKIIPIDIIKIIKMLKKEYIKHPELHNKTFKEFFVKIFDEQLYKTFITFTGYTDYENADLYETLYKYGMEDNIGGWVGLHIPWKDMIDKLYNIIGKKHFKFSNNVLEIKKIKQNPCLFEIKTEKGLIYNSNKVIIATTITGIQKLVPNASNKKSLYQQIHGQSFLRLYAKFDKKSCEIMKKYITGYTVVPEPLQKIIPINSDKGIYMIAYSDNFNAYILNLEDTPENRDFYCRVIEKSLGIQKGTLKIIAVKKYYWQIGTHYYEPLRGDFKNRKDFINKAQHPEDGMLVVGEAVSRDQGWVEGALESVNIVLNDIRR